MIKQREIKLELKDSLKDLSQVTTKAISDYVYKNLNSSDDIDLVKEALNKPILTVLIKKDDKVGQVLLTREQENMLLNYIHLMSDGDIKLLECSFMDLERRELKNDK